MLRALRRLGLAVLMAPAGRAEDLVWHSSHRCFFLSGLCEGESGWPSLVDARHLNDTQFLQFGLQKEVCIVVALFKSRP